MKINLLLITILLYSIKILGQEVNISKLSLEEISQRLDNPLSNLWSITLQENFYINSGDLIDGTENSNVFFFQPFMPFPVGKNKMFILRPVFPLVTQPYNSQNELGITERKHKTGFGDMQLITAYGPDQESGTIWGIGATFIFPTASSEILGRGKWQAGPTAMIVSLLKPWTLGLVIQHWVSFAGDKDRPDQNKTDIQYVARYALPEAWSIGMGPNVSINWEADAGNRVTFPIGLGITKTVRWGNTPIKMRIEPQYSIIKPKEYGTEWNIRIQIAPVINRPF